MIDISIKTINFLSLRWCPYLFVFRQSLQQTDFEAVHQLLTRCLVAHTGIPPCARLVDTGNKAADGSGSTALPLAFMVGVDPTHHEVALRKEIHIHLL